MASRRKISAYRCCVNSAVAALHNSFRRIPRTITNDLGEFRISGIAPGKYYLCANWDAFRGGGGRASERVIRQGREETAPAIYFPETLDQSQAREIQITAGAQLHGFDLQLQKVRAFRVSGRVVLPDDADANS
jgi:hypothetical protein